jgi:hypothetical protein
MPRTSFWHPEVAEILVQMGRQDLLDRGDALGERVAALLLTAHNRLKDYMEIGDLYANKGGASLLDSDGIVESLEHFVNVRLRAEIDALEQLLETFDNISQSSPIHETSFRVSLL